MDEIVTATAGPRRADSRNSRNPHGEREFTRQDKKLATVRAFTTVSPGLRFCDQVLMLPTEEQG